MAGRAGAPSTEEVAKRVRSCVACNRPGAGPLKILSCLHGMCVDCVRQYVSKDGTVSCFKCLTVDASGKPGARLEDCLVNWPAEDEHDSERSVTNADRSRRVCQNADCEGENEPAAFICMDCGLHLCDQHGILHGKKRSTCEHRIVSIEGERSGAPVALARTCPLHPNWPFSKYCGQCKVLACNRCDTLTHADHTDLDDVQEAGDRRLQELQSKLDGCSERWKEILHDAKKAVSVRITEINDRTEELSATVSADVEEHIANIRRREQQLLGDLDRARWMKVKDLEIQSQTFEEQSHRTECCERLLAKLSIQDVLAMEETLEKHISEFVQVTSSVSDTSPLLPAVEFDIAYEPFANHEKISSSTLGRLTCSDPEFECEGIHTELSAGAAAVPVIPKFNPFTAFANITLSGDHYEANREGTENNFGAVSTMGAFRHGIVECRVQVVAEGSAVLIGVEEEDFFAGRNLRKTERVHGWRSRDRRSDLTTGSGSKLSQTWRDLDVIRLQLDCDQHKLTATHQRTGASESIPVPDSPLCFVAFLSCGSTVRMLT